MTPTPSSNPAETCTSLSRHDIQRLAAFHDDGAGGNPAGVAIVASLPDEPTMRRLAAEIGYSETAFACREDGAWRVRYFSPESEVPFCGHATIALGAALAAHDGGATFELRLNEATITVQGHSGADGSGSASLLSPPTSSEPAQSTLVTGALALFGYEHAWLDPSLPPLIARAGATHLVLALRSRETLAAMAYDLDAGRELMNRAGLVTIALVHARATRAFDVRNAFASGGVMEDPATGAAAAALAGALRDRGLRDVAPLRIVQGEDMGARSIIVAEPMHEIGAPVRVSGAVRRLP